MFSLTSSHRYLLYPGYVGMGKGVYGLFHLVRSKVDGSPCQGDVYLFVGKDRRQMKLLHWEDGGFVLYHKKLAEGTFELPRFQPKEGLMQLDWRLFILIMEGVDLKNARVRKRFSFELNI